MKKINFKLSPLSVLAFLIFQLSCTNEIEYVDKTKLIDCPLFRELRYANVSNTNILGCIIYSLNHDNPAKIKKIEINGKKKKTSGIETLLLGSAKQIEDQVLPLVRTEIMDLGKKSQEAGNVVKDWLDGKQEEATNEDAYSFLVGGQNGGIEIGIIPSFMGAVMTSVQNKGAGGITPLTLSELLFFMQTFAAVADPGGYFNQEFGSALKVKSPFMDGLVWPFLRVLIRKIGKVTCGQAGTQAYNGPMALVPGAEGYQIAICKEYLDTVYDKNGARVFNSPDAYFNNYASDSKYNIVRQYFVGEFAGLIIHEARHTQGFGHASCGGGTGNCDERLFKASEFANHMAAELVGLNYSAQDYKKEGGKKYKAGLNTFIFGAAFNNKLPGSYSYSIYSPMYFLANLPDSEDTKYNPNAKADILLAKQYYASEVWSRMGQFKCYGEANTRAETSKIYRRLNCIMSCYAGHTTYCNKNDFEEPAKSSYAVGGSYDCPVEELNKYFLLSADTSQKPVFKLGKMFIYETALSASKNEACAASSGSAGYSSDEAPASEPKAKDNSDNKESIANVMASFAIQQNPSKEDIKDLMKNLAEKSPPAHCSKLGSSAIK